MALPILPLPSSKGCIDSKYKCEIAALTEGAFSRQSFLFIFSWLNHAMN
jgi:hypothetical protein